jgi:spore maturation protein CgeB
MTKQQSQSQHLRVLYVGPISGTCLDRAYAMRRLGHELVHISLRDWLPNTVWVDRITWRLGGHWFAPWLVWCLKRALQGQKFDLAYVDNGEHVSPMVLRALRRFAPTVVNYNIDDPTGPRDKARFLAYRRAAAMYDLLAVVREDNLPECVALGAKKVIRVWRSADEISHAPREISPEIAQKWASEVLFLGTWMPGRGAFMLELIRLGVPLTIRGANWHKAPEWQELKSHWKGGQIEGNEYAWAIQCAKINLGLLSKGNRDLHTTRSLEIPSLGGLFCAERTTEHMATYQEGVEAVFWKDEQECAQVCKQLLADDALRQQIAVAGHARFKANGHGNEDILRQVLAASQGSSA